MSFSLTDKVALVTGSSRGIGASIAKRLAKAGAIVLVHYRSGREQAEAVLKEIQKDSPQSDLVGFDLSNNQEVEATAKALLEKYEAIPIVVANAGIAEEALLPRASYEHFQKIINTNLLGSMNIVRVFSRAMMRNRYGRIILLSSVVGESGNIGQSAYAASKSGLFGFAKSVAIELGSRGVTCNLIAPGFIKTEMTQRLPEEVKSSYMERIPARRFGNPEEVASAAQYLASEEAGYINGATIDVNGGMLMR